MATTFNVLSVWDLGSTIHVIGTIHDGVITGGELLRGCDDECELSVKSVALGGGSNLPAGAITLVVDFLPCPKDELIGKKLRVLENGFQDATTSDATAAKLVRSRRNVG